MIKCNINISDNFSHYKRNIEVKGRLFEDCVNQ